MRIVQKIFICTHVDRIESIGHFLSAIGTRAEIFGCGTIGFTFRCIIDDAILVYRAIKQSPLDILLFNYLTSISVAIYFREKSTLFLVEFLLFWWNLYRLEFLYKTTPSFLNNFKLKIGILLRAYESGEDKSTNIPLLRYSPLKLE